jgi:hypothetical protein
MKQFPQKKVIEVIHINETFIHIENVVYKKHDGNEEKELKIIASLVHIVGKLIGEKKQKPIFALTTILNNNQKVILMADVSLVIGSPKTGIFTLVDNKTLLPISTVTFSNQAVGANSNPELASFALDPANPNQVIGSGIAAGSGTVVITTHADYTDPGDNSAQSGDFSVTKNYTIIASADGVTFDVVFP